MNHLILIGNGFDLAHGLKTDYNSFMVGYLKRCLTHAFDQTNMKYEDELIEVINNNPTHNLQFSGDIKFPVNGISDLVEHYYRNGLSSLLNDERLFVNSNSTFNINPFKIKIKSQLFKILLTKCEPLTWVEIENEFYRQLRNHIKTPVNNDSLDHLNESLRAIIRELELYLSTLNTDVKIDELENILELPNSRHNRRTMILNFNYTNTVEKYISNGSTIINYIHGKIGDLQNPLIFGFGDEIDSDYHEMELKNNNRFFEFIKTFWYLRTRNYNNLSNFIREDTFSVSILGHSCGLSDRTLLNMIFESNYCKAVKIYYYQNERGNNYTNITHEISRHFKNKINLRSIVTALPDCQSFPQLINR